MYRWIATVRPSWRMSACPQHHRESALPGNPSRDRSSLNASTLCFGERLGDVPSRIGKELRGGVERSAVSAPDWELEITGLVARSTTFTFEQIRRFPKRTVESVFVCSGDPRRPTLPLRRVANVRWGGVGLADLLNHVGVQPEATHLWSYGLDHGEFFGFDQDHYVKDMPLSRLKHGNACCVRNERQTAPSGKWLPCAAGDSRLLRHQLRQVALPAGVERAPGHRLHDNQAL
jgi:molybdopterin-dependent oxidoreductase-like protein protein